MRKETVAQKSMQMTRQGQLENTLLTRCIQNPCGTVEIPGAELDDYGRAKVEQALAKFAVGGWSIDSSAPRALRRTADSTRHKEFEKPIAERFQKWPEAAITTSDPDPPLRNLWWAAKLFFAANCVLFWAVAHYYHRRGSIPHSTFGGSLRRTRSHPGLDPGELSSDHQRSKAHFRHGGRRSHLGAIFAGYFSKTVAKHSALRVYSLNGVASLHCTVLMATMWHSLKSGLAATSETARR